MEWAYSTRTIAHLRDFPVIFTFDINFGIIGNGCPINANLCLGPSEAIFVAINDAYDDFGTLFITKIRNSYENHGVFRLAKEIGPVQAVTKEIFH